MVKYNPDKNRDWDVLIEETDVRGVAEPSVKDVKADIRKGEYWEKIYAGAIQGTSEVKTEMGVSVPVADKPKWTETGNSCIEYKWRGNESGIMTTTSRNWAQVLTIDDELFGIWIMPTPILKTAIAVLEKKGKLVRHKVGDEKKADSYLINLIKDLFTKNMPIEIMNAHKATSTTRPTTESQQEASLLCTSTSQA